MIPGDGGDVVGGAPSRARRHHDVVVVGAGNAGISLAARLRRDGLRDVAVVDPVLVHRYRPLYSYVGGGQARVRDLERPQSHVIPRGVHWYPHRVTAVDPVARTVRLADGTRLAGSDLVVCPGVEPDWEHVPGSREAVFSEHGASNYVDERAPHTWRLVSGLRRGRAVFVVDDGPVPCAGAGLKPLYLAADHWRRSGVLDQIEITVVVGWPTLFGIDRVDAELEEAAARYGIRVLTATSVTAVDPDRRRLQLGSSTGAGGTGGPVELDYDLLHLVPRHRAPSWVGESDLAGPTSGGMVEVSPTTLAHRRHPGVWGLGDAADVAASRSGGALRKQVPVLAANIERRRSRRPLVHYDGYSTAPITVARDRLVLAEFDRSGRLTPSVPVIDLVRPRRLTWCYDRYLQPRLYWHSILKGRVSR